MGEEFGVCFGKPILLLVLFNSFANAYYLIENSCGQDVFLTKTGGKRREKDTIKRYTDNGASYSCPDDADRACIGGTRAGCCRI